MKWHSRSVGKANKVTAGPPSVEKTFSEWRHGQLCPQLLKNKSGRDAVEKDRSGWWPWQVPYQWSGQEYVKVMGGKTGALTHKTSREKRGVHLILWERRCEFEEKP